MTQVRLDGAYERLLEVVEEENSIVKTGATTLVVLPSMIEIAGHKNTQNTNRCVPGIVLPCTTLLPSLQPVQITRMANDLRWYLDSFDVQNAHRQSLSETINLAHFSLTERNVAKDANGEFCHHGKQC